MMRKFGTLFVLGILVACAQNARAVDYLYVLRMGDGAAALANSPNAVPTFIDKYTSTGTYQSTVTMPTTLTGSNHPLTEAANSTSIGHLSVSTNGQYLVLTGYDADAGTTNIRQGTTGRVIGRVTISSGAVDTTTSLSDAYPGSANNSEDIRSAVSTNGTDFWATGVAFPTTSGQGGVQYATLGATTGIRMAPQATNTRVANIYNNQLYISSNTGAFVGISKVGTGVTVPTADDQSTTSLLFGTGSGTSPYDFWFKDDNTVYVADDRITSSGGGIQKWTFDSGLQAWALQYTLTTNLGTGGVRGLDGTIVGGNAVLYASTAPSTSDGTIQNKIVTVTDTGATSSFSDVFSAGTNTTVRGVVFVAGPACSTGDLNCDGHVDARDYVYWRKTNGPAGDYTSWRANFGNPPGAGSGGGLSGGPVPEPASAVMFVLGTLALCWRRRTA
jgi:hypothetical protein